MSETTTTTGWPDRGMPIEHVMDRDGYVWRVVRDGGMATRAHQTGLISIGIAELGRTAGPLRRVLDPADPAVRETITRALVEHSSQEIGTWTSGGSAVEWRCRCGVRVSGSKGPSAAHKDHLAEEIAAALASATEGAGA